MKNLGLKAKINYQSFQKGDVFKTHASIKKIEKYYGFKPKTKVEIGVKKFIDWFIENKGKYKIEQKKTNVIALIPTRLGSKRLLSKPLLEIKKSINNSHL